MRVNTPIIGSLFVVAAVIAGCSSTGASTAPSVAPVSQAPASQAPVSQAPVSQAPASSEPSSSSGETVETKSVGSIGTVLVAGSNGMTVYTFTQDTKDSGKSACTGDCAATWPPLTVAAGATPSAGTGVTGTLATITRNDGTIQVTYKGLPLYFFKNDHAPGDANGVYTNWEAVKP
jgi:predicted lipoprotein with Yx(FWY)xxD motif